MDAVRKGQAMNEEDAEYYAHLEKNRGEGDDEDDDDSSSSEKEDEDEKDEDHHRRKKRIHEDNGEVPEEEEEFKELIRLRGLDVSLLRFQLEEAKKESALHAIKNQGKLRERDRRTAMRLLKQGDEDGALAITKRAGVRDDQDDENDEEQEDDDDHEEEVPTKNMTKDSQLDLNKLSKYQQQQQEPRSIAAVVAGKPKLNLAKNKPDDGEDTPSDEETL